VDVPGESDALDRPYVLQSQNLALLNDLNRHQTESFIDTQSVIGGHARIDAGLARSDHVSRDDRVRLDSGARHGDFGALRLRRGMGAGHKHDAP
jgi:hypothetical protein